MNILCVILILHSLTQLYESSVSPRLLSLWALVPWDTVKEKKFSMVTKLVKLCIWGGSVGKIFCHSHISGSCPQTTASKGQQEHSPQPMCQRAKKNKHSGDSDEQQDEDLALDCRMFSQGAVGCSDKGPEPPRKTEWDTACHGPSWNTGGKTGKTVTEQPYFIYPVR